MFQGALEWSNMGTPALKWDRMELDPPDVSRKLDDGSTSAGGKQRHQPVRVSRLRQVKLEKCGRNSEMACMDGEPCRVWDAVSSKEQ